MVETPDKITLPRSARDGRVQRRIQDHLGLLKRRQLTKVPQKLEEPQIAWQIRFADAPKHPQVGLEQRKETLGSVLVDIPTRIFLLCMIDEVVHVARQRPIATGRVGIQATVHRR